MSSLPITRSLVEAELIGALKAHDNAREALAQSEITTGDVAWAKSCLEHEIELLDAAFQKTLEHYSGARAEEAAR